MISISRFTLVWAVRSQAMKPCSDGVSRLLVVESEIEKFVERVVGLGSEPREEPLAASLGPQHTRIERERRLPRPRGETVERGGGFGEVALRLRFCPQRRAQRSLALPGELEQVVVVEAEQRRLEHGREREIVVGQQQRVREHHQVHDRDMLGQHQPVGAGDRDTVGFQGADDGLEQRPALAHQHQYVARAGALPGPALDVPGDLRRQPHLRAPFGQFVERRIPGLDIALVVGLERIPDLDEAGRRVRQREVRRDAVPRRR